MNERRIHRLEAQIRARVAQVVGYELADPQRGLITITRVELDREMAHCKVLWSVLGDAKARAANDEVLQRARGFVQREVGKILHTRSVPRLHFEFDESIAGAIRIDAMLKKLREEREARGEPAEGTGLGEAQAGEQG